MSFLPRSRRGALWRFALGALIVIVFTAATTAVAGLLQFKQLVKDISVTPPLKHAQIVIANPGNSQTLLLIGSDHRAGTPWYSANTDTMMLVRIDPNSTTINLLSIPRDLEVQLYPGGGVGKLNAAYSIGGPNALVRILRAQVFPGLQVNHIIDVNFGGFQALVNALGCVYVDVDHRYYNNTAYTDYSSIDVQPGYQKLCGSDALAFVRFRHTDNDIVRNARQQDFLRWVKDEFGTGYLISSRDRLLRIFGKHTQTDADLHSIDGLINLFNLVAFSAGHTIKQVPFPAVLQPCGGAPAPGGGGAVPGCYVTADPVSEQQVFHEFMTPTLVAPPTPGTTAPQRTTRPRRGAHRASAASQGLMADVADGRAQVHALGRIGLPVYFPRLIFSGSNYCLAANGNCPVQMSGAGSYPRAYEIHDRSGIAYASYRMTLEINPVLGQYFGVEGTAWLDPPILRHPSGSKVVAGKTLSLYANGGKLSVVAWRTASAVYWISNTLTDELTNQQMVAIAGSLTR